MLLTSTASPVLTKIPLDPKDIAHQLEPSVTIRLVESVGKQISKSLSPFRNF